MCSLDIKCLEASLKTENLPKSCTCTMALLSDCARQGQLEQGFTSVSIQPCNSDLGSSGMSIEKIHGPYCK